MRAVLLNVRIEVAEGTDPELVAQYVEACIHIGIEGEPPDFEILVPQIDVSAFEDGV